MDYKALVSVIVPTRNRLSNLRRCVDSIVKNTPPIFYELIIVDGGEPSAEADEYYKSIKKLAKILNVYNSESYSQSMNAGIREAKGDYITIPGIADDIEVKEGWIKNMLPVFENKRVGMGVFAVDERGLGGIVYGGNMSPEGYNYDHNVEPQYAGYGLVPRKVLNKVGLMDESYKPIYLEDADYGFTVRKHGYKLIPVPDAIIVHNHENQGRFGHNDANLIYFKSKWQI